MHKYLFTAVRPLGGRGLVKLTNGLSDRSVSSHPSTSCDSSGFSLEERKYLSTKEATKHHLIQSCLESATFPNCDDPLKWRGVASGSFVPAGHITYTHFYTLSIHLLQGYQIILTWTFFVRWPKLVIWCANINITLLIGHIKLN